METKRLEELRKQSGMAIAKTSHIVRMVDNEWAVPSQTRTGAYTVRIFQDNQTCLCPDFAELGLKCKHIYAVEIKQTLQVVNTDGSKTTITKKITYSQDWANYTKAQNKEGKLFKDLLKDLVENVEEEPYTFGRPKVPLKTSLFCAIDKVYSMQSSRRAYSRYKEAEIKQFINKAPNYNVINKLLNDLR
jgi:Txe/YoeB family toxin of Txe-Axe toxin-antitoxin module